MASSIAERAEGAPVGRGTFRRGVRWRRAAEYLSFAPFAAFVIVFLLWPAYIVVTGAFIDAAGHPSTDAVLAVVTQQAFVDAFGASIRLSATREQARRGHGLPGVQPLPAPLGPGERRVRAAARDPPGARRTAPRAGPG